MEKYKYVVAYWAEWFHGTPKMDSQFRFYHSLMAAKRFCDLFIESASYQSVAYQCNIYRLVDLE